MKTKKLFPLCALLAAFGSALATADEIKTIVITANDMMRFNVQRIEATPGQKLRVQLRNEGTLPREVMAHNWILLKSAADANAYSAAAAAAGKENYRPASLNGEVLASIQLVGAKQMGEVVFDAPTARGAYPFLCSFPGHCQIGMRGELVVQ